MSRFTVALGSTAVTLVIMAAAGLDGTVPLGTCIALAVAGGLVGLVAYALHKDREL